MGCFAKENLNDFNNYFFKKSGTQGFAAKSILDRIEILT
jgi:hypothetical protein